LAEDAWRLLDHSLYRSYFWPNWDRCLRIRQTTIEAFVGRGLDAAAFARITGRDDVFALLVEIAASSFRGQQYLRLVKDLLLQDDNRHERPRIVRRALWVDCLQLLGQDKAGSKIHSGVTQFTLSQPQPS